MTITILIFAGGWACWYLRTDGAAYRKRSRHFRRCGCAVLRRARRWKGMLPRGLYAQFYRMR